MGINNHLSLTFVLLILVYIFAMDSKAESDKTWQDIEKELSPKKQDNEIGIMVRNLS